MFLGLDLGTSALKAVLIDDRERLTGEASAALRLSRPHDGWSEQDPADWIAAAEAVFDALGADHDLAGVDAIGLSGQMHGATLLGAGDAVLRPCMLWNDTRAAHEAALLDASPPWRETTGNIVFPGFTAPKLEWVRRHEADVFAKVVKVLLPKDYLRLWLTGACVSDLSDASGTAWLDVGARDWSDALLERSGLSRDRMPAVIEGSATSGDLRGEVARRWGFRPATPVAGGGGDNAAAAVGAGVVEQGTAFISLGTSGVLFVATDGYHPAARTAVHTFCHALPRRWHQMGVILAATDALNWLARLVRQDAAQLTGDLGRLRPPGPLFLPHLGGERTPMNDAAARAAFVGLSHTHDVEAMTRAVLEGVAFAFRECRDALARTGPRIERAVALGGGSRSAYWLELLATVLGITIDVPAAGELGAAFGAARLGRMARTGTMEAAPPPIALSIEPEITLTDAFDEAHGRWRAAYGALKEVR